jgi:hypothetical protein
MAAALFSGEYRTAEYKIGNAFSPPVLPVIPAKAGMAVGEGGYGPDPVAQRALSDLVAVETLMRVEKLIETSATVAAALARIHEAEEALLKDADATEKVYAASLT